MRTHAFNTIFLTSFTHFSSTHFFIPNTSAICLFYDLVVMGKDNLISK